MNGAHARLPAGWAGRARHASAVVVAATLALAPHAAAVSAVSLTATASPTELGYSGSVTVSGSVGTAAVLAVVLEADAYPYRGFATLASTTSSADGSYSFAGVRLDRNSRLRVALQAADASAGASAGASASAPIAVTVDPSVAVNAISFGAGRVRLSMRLGHTLHGGSTAPVEASWFAAPRGTHAFRLLALTRTRELAPGLTYASATIDPPARRFVYRVCLHPGWQRAMGRPAGHARCPRGAGGLAAGGEGRGIPLAPYPSAAAIAAAARYLAGRAGRTSFAVLDSSGRLSGVRVREHFETASVVKVMMLVAFLQMRSAERRGLSSADTALLYPMIHISDNNAASAVYAIVGSAAVSRVARESRMTDYAPGVGWWAFAQTSAADQARFFFALGRLIPERFYAYARGLLAGIEPSQSWGVPPVARPRWQVFFKTGALPSQGLFNEVARLERPGVTFTLAVFTDGDPSMSYGEQTIEGVAAALLAHTP
jgi:Beta-lactamase enzyme family